MLLLVNSTETFLQPPTQPVFRLPGGEGLARPFFNIIENLLGLTRLEYVHRCLQGVPFNPEQALKVLGVSWQADEQDLKGIPPSGPLIVTANHPFGGLEGIVLLALLKTRRKDVKILANSLLSRVPELRDDFIFVNVFGGEEARLLNQRPLREALRWLRGGGVLAAFPAGEVSSFDLGKGRVADPPWSNTIGRLLRLSGAPALPVFFHGQNGFGFHAAGLVHPRLRTALLPLEILNKKGKVVLVEVGSPVAASRLARLGSEDEMTEYLRYRTYLLKARKAKTKILPFPLLNLKAPKPPLASPLPNALLEDEISRLPEGRRLAFSGELEAYLALAPEIPGVLREVGRLREVTFRACGEGTGKPLDLDSFDGRYQHLVLWNKAAKEVVGGYRMAGTDRILPSWGTSGLYTSTLFKYRPEFFQALKPALELGRSFIRPEYQREYAPLFLLWKGLGAFVAENNRYRYLFGVVSMSDDYRPLSKEVLMRHLIRHKFRAELSAMALPRNPYRGLPLKDHEWEARAEWDEGLEEVSDWVEDVERGRGVPVLLRQYLKLGAEFLGFNVDPRFAHVLDGLLVVDLTKTDSKALDKYLGRDGARSFLAFHGMSSPAAQELAVG